MNLQNKQIHRLRDRTYDCCGEEGWKGIVWEFGIDMYTLVYLKWKTNKDLHYSTKNSAQFYGEAWIAGNLGKKRYMFVYN